MRIPNKIKVGGHTYKVVLTDDHEILDDALACMDEHQLTIWIDSRAPKSIQESSFVHEIFHTLNATLSENHIGHALLESLAEQFYQVLADNKL